MSKNVYVPTSDQLIGAIIPHDDEGPRGYLRRVAREWGYTDSLCLVHLAKAKESDIDRHGAADKVAYALRLRPEEWSNIAYRRLGPVDPKRSILFSDHWIGYGMLTFAHPRICIACFREKCIEKKIWEICLLSVCPHHGCYLINACPQCGKLIPRRRANVHLCSCGHDLRTGVAVDASREEWEICIAIARASGVATTELPTSGDDFKYFPEIATLLLNDLLNLIFFLGTIQKDGLLVQNPCRSTRADLNRCTEITYLAAKTLSQWPSNLFALLAGTQAAWNADKAKGRIALVFSPFYGRLYKQFSGEHFTFFRNAFERFICTQWNGSFKQQGKWCRSFSANELDWISGQDAVAASGIAHPERLVRTGYVEGYFVPVSMERVECWINKKSLLAWCQQQDECTPRLDAARQLGISYRSITSLSDAGLIRRTVSQRDSRHHFMRSDVRGLLALFSGFAVPTVDHWDRSELILLKEAVGTTLCGNEQLSTAFRAIEEGHLVPVARSVHHVGIASYLFLRSELRIHRYAIASRKDLGQIVNGTDASRILGIADGHIRGLVAEGLLRPIHDLPTRYLRESFFKLSDVRDIQERFALSTAIADRLGVSRRALINHLHRWGMIRLAVPSKPHGYRWKLIDRTIADSIISLKSGARGRLTITRAASCLVTKHTARTSTV